MTATLDFRSVQISHDMSIMSSAMVTIQYYVDIQLCIWKSSNNMLPHWITNWSTLYVVLILKYNGEHFESI